MASNPFKSLEAPHDGADKMGRFVLIIVEKTLLGFKTKQRIKHAGFWNRNSQNLNLNAS